MIEEKKIGEERYICNQCNKEYDIRNAITAKGNIFFCSMECVLKYDEERRN